MPSRRALLTFAFVALLVPSALVACDEDGEPREAVTSSSETPRAGGGEGVAEIPGEIGDNGDEWPLANKDYENTRADLDADISAENVDDLGVAWTAPLPGQGAYGAFASAPLIADGVVYYQDLGSNVFAVDLESGEMKWEHRYDSPVVGPNGPAIGYGKVFVETSVDSIAALDIETGEEVWSIEVDYPVGAMQPSAYDGIVYVGTVAGAIDAGAGDLGLRGYAGGTSGHILALDQASGDVLWDFMTVEEGFWGNPEVNSGGGVWYPPAIDTETGTAFFGTGNPAPFPGTVEFPNGSSRPGANLHTDSMIAFDHRTGEVKWFEQVNPHDLFDHDFQAPRILADVAIDGADRSIVIGSGKLGRVIAFDRESGEVLWDTPVGEHQNDDLDELPPGEVVEVLPGVLGGVETPMAYADGTVYVPVVNLPTPMTADGFGAADGSEAVQNLEQRTDIVNGTGVIVALDAATGEIDWETELTTGPIFGGATVVNDLVFTSTFDGTIYALERDDGAVAWEMKAPAGINAWPAVAGDTIIFGAGAGPSSSLIALRIGAEGGVTPEATGAASPGAEPTAAAPGAGGGAATPGATQPAGSTTLQIATLQGSTFDKTELRAPAGAEVTVEYTNDTPIPHNIHFFSGNSADAESLAMTEIASGPGNVQTASFTAPPAGNYFFRCDVHPQQMQGTLVTE